jgi:hypothetical protein
MNLQGAAPAQYTSWEPIGFTSKDGTALTFDNVAPWAIALLELDYVVTHTP